jgi:hypothetical protein
MIKRNKSDDGMRFLECATKPRFRCYQYDIANIFAEARGEKLAKKAKTRTVHRLREHRARATAFTKPPCKINIAKNGLTLVAAKAITTKYSMPDDFSKDYTQPLKNNTCFILTAAYQCIESCAAMHYVMDIHYVMHIAQLPAQHPRAYDCL